MVISHGNSWEVEQLRELLAHHAAQLVAVAGELQTQRPATAQAGVRSGMSLVDTALLTKTNVDAGELDGKEQWSTRSFKMKACCAAVASGLGELMESASLQELETRQDARTPNAAPSTNLFHVLDGL